MSRGKYEREIRDILQGDEERIEKVTKTMAEEETETYKNLIDRPLIANRAGGSLGTDIVACRGIHNFLIEVKSTKKDIIYLSDQKRLQEQREQLKTKAIQSQVLPIYAIRRKRVRGEKWKVFTLDLEGKLDVDDRVDCIYQMLPDLAETTHGNYKIEFANGRPFSVFIKMIYITEDSEEEDWMEVEDDRRGFFTGDFIDSEEEDWMGVKET